MVEGIFREGALRVSLVIFAANEQQHTLECLIDTGFAGQLKLSPYWVGILQLPKFGEERFRMADGRWGVHEIYRAQILWGEVEQEIEVVQIWMHGL